MDASPRQRRARLWLSRLGWLVLIWTCSVLALGTAAWAVRILMNAGGLSA